MSKAFIDENHLVDRYVQGKLSGPELESFEIYMLEHTEIARDVEFARGFVTAVNESNELKELGPPSEDRPTHSSLWKPLAIAATSLLVISLSLVGYMLDAGDPSSSGLRLSDSPVRVGDSEILEVVRGQSLPTIDLREDHSVLIEADVIGDPTAIYAIELHNLDGSFVMQRSGLNAEDGLVAIQLVNPPPGTYSLRIVSSADAAIFAEYQFDLVAQQP